MSVTTRVAISRRARRYKLACADGTPDRCTVNIWGEEGEAGRLPLGIVWTLKDIPGR